MKWVYLAGGLAALGNGLAGYEAVLPIRGAHVQRWVALVLICGG